MTRTEKLTLAINVIFEKNKAEIESIEHKGPRGGSNAALIEGWAAPGIHGLTLAINKSLMPTMQSWSGSLPTPTTAFPSCTLRLCMDAYNKVYGL